MSGTRTLGAAFFAGAGFAASFFASFTVPEGPIAYQHPGLTVQVPKIFDGIDVHEWLHRDVVPVRAMHPMRRACVSQATATMAMDGSDTRSGVNVPFGWANSPFSTPLRRALLNCESNDGPDTLGRLLLD